MAEREIHLKRTGLYASGCSPVNMIQAVFYNEDMLVYDLEDSVPASEKDAARIASQDEVLQYLTAVMRGEETEEVVVVESCGEGISEARRMDKALAGRDRIKAAELLGKRYLLFGERVDMAGDLQVVIDYDYGDDDTADTGGV